jgi:site-specific recombinase XerD
MFKQTVSQRILAVGNDDYIPALIVSFLTDRKAQGLTASTIGFYREKLSGFAAYCEAQALEHLAELTPDFIRQYLLRLGETHNAGGVHAHFRTLRAFLRWVDLEEILEGWKNPIRKIKAPRVDVQPIEGVTPEDVAAMIQVCSSDFLGVRDKAVLLTLFDTGLRSKEFYSLDLADLDLANSALLIHKSKSRKPRLVYFGRRTRRAIRSYLKQRPDNYSALWLSRSGERMTHATLRSILQHRAALAGITTPSPHDFRRGFALAMLRSGADVFSIQRLLGHADLTVLRRYLAQTDADTQAAHAKHSPIDNLNK